MGRWAVLGCHPPVWVGRRRPGVGCKSSLDHLLLCPNRVPSQKCMLVSCFFCKISTLSGKYCRCALGWELALNQWGAAFLPSRGGHAGYKNRALVTRTALAWVVFLQPAVSTLLHLLPGNGAVAPYSLPVFTKTGRRRCPPRTWASARRSLHQFSRPFASLLQFMCSW